jgi:hypothetical protein
MPNVPCDSELSFLDCPFVYLLISHIMHMNIKEGIRIKKKDKLKLFYVVFALLYMRLVL